MSTSVNPQLKLLFATLTVAVGLSGCSEASGDTRSYAIVDTDQAECYASESGAPIQCADLGYDADHEGNQLDYMLSADGLTVTDNVTGLVWQQSSDRNADGLINYDDKLFQTEALSYCNELSLSGNDDWRLPNIKEAFSLIIFSGEDASGYRGSDTSVLIPFLDEAFDWAFGDLNSDRDRIIDAQYASSTLYLSTTMYGNPTMFGVNYIDGRIKGYPSHTKEFYVRCVTGNEDYGINDLVASDDQTVNDQATGLMWQQNDFESTNWDNAIAECKAATTASYDDWRLPNVKELQSLVDYTKSPDTHNSAAISPLFNTTSILNEAGETDWGSYWASTTHLDFSGAGSNASYVAFGRSLGYLRDAVTDVHGAGAQRSDDKTNVSQEPGVRSATGANGTFYYKGPQGDILRDNNMVRCVRDI